MIKYGIENFTISEVEIVNDYNILSDREKYWISFYDSYNNGYNSSKGGEGEIIYDYDLICPLTFYEN